MKILFLAPRIPLPADTGGKIRTLNILKQLALHHQVHLVCFSFEYADREHISALEQLGIKVTLVPMEEPSLLQKVLGVLFSPIPFSIFKYYSKQMDDVIKELLKIAKYDAVHIDHLHMAHYHHLFGQTPTFLDEHNVEFKILERCAEVEKSLIKKLLYRNQAEKMKTFEGKMAKTFTGIFACSLDDQLILSKLTVGMVQTHVIPNGVDTEFFNAPIKTDLKENFLVFTGSMDWLPNDDAITYFCERILPLVWQKLPDTKLYVVGKSPSAAVKALALNDSRVIVTGRVDDVRTYIENAKVFIVPLRIGGGTRLKILEAMAMRKAIVSTSIGAEGIKCRDGINITLADNPESFTQRIVDILGNETFMTQLGQEGRNLVCDQYDWHIVGKTLTAIYTKAIK